MLYFNLVSDLVSTGIGYSSAQAVSLGLCVLIPFVFCSVLFVIEEGKGMMLLCSCFC